jgi:hypothetical protein
MIGLESLRWALTCAFAVATGFHLMRVLRPAGAGHIDEVLHLSMGGSMIAMIWPWGSSVPASVWVTGFTLATGWFVSRAIMATGGRLGPIHFAFATAAMLWMAAPTSTDKREMSGMAGMGHEHGGGAHPAWVGATLGAYLVGAALWWVAHGMRLLPAADTPRLLPAAEIPRLLPTADSPSRAADAPRWPEVCHAAMSAAMGLALLAMT